VQTPGKSRYDDSERNLPGGSAEGTIIQLDNASMMVHIAKMKGQGVCMTECLYTLDDKTVFVENNEMIHVSKVGEGSRVRFDYVIKNGTAYPRGIIVLERKEREVQKVPQSTSEKARKTTDPPELLIKDIVFNSKLDDYVLHADEKGVIKITARNNGKGKGSDVYLVLKQNKQIGVTVKDRYPVGTLLPNEERTVQAVVKASPDIPTADIEFKVSLVDGNGFDSPPVILALTTKAFAPPLLQVTEMDVKDSEGKRVFSKGKEVAVTLTVENAGQGVAKNVEALIDAGSPDIKVLGDTKIKMGKFSPGAARKVIFTLVVTQRYNGPKNLPVTFLLREARDKFSLKPDVRLVLGEEAPERRVVKVRSPEVRQAAVDTEPDIASVPVIDAQHRAFREDDIAIVIGIERYQNLPKSDYSYNDAKLVRSYLKALGFAERNIDFIADEKATLSGMRKSLESWLSNRVRKNSRVFVYYSGHGSPDPVTGEAYMVPHDGDPAYLTDTGYRLKSLYESLAKLPAEEVTVVLDACFSGAGGRSVLAAGARPAVARVDDIVISSPTMAVMSSTQGTQISTVIPDKEHGVFTYYFLKAIKEGKRDIAEIYRYLKPLVEDEARRQNVSQSPLLTPSPEGLTGRFLVIK
jgi:hypothetical protein